MLVDDDPLPLLTLGANELVLELVIGRDKLEYNKLHYTYECISCLSLFL